MWQNQTIFKQLEGCAKNLLFWGGWFLFPIICHLMPFPAQVCRQQKDDGLRDVEDACRIYSINPFCWAGITFQGSKARKGNNRRRNVYFNISLHSKNSPSTSQISTNTQTTLRISFCHYRIALSVIPFSSLLTVYSCAYLQAELREKWHPSETMRLIYGAGCLY